MTNAIQPRATMAWLVITYVTTLGLGVAVFIAILWALARYANLSYPVGVMIFILPMMAAMQAGVSYFKQTGRAASFGTSALFGVITTLVLLAGMVALWQSGQLDGILSRIDPGAFGRGEIGTVLLPLGIVIGGLGLFCNILMFWASARGQVKQQERKARKAAEKAR